MEKKNETKRSLTMRSIFRNMMEGGYYPTFNKTHILFEHDDNIAVLEYEEGILSVRLFFTIDEEAYDLFLEASNASMLDTFIVKPVILDDMTTIMFSCETFCDTLHEFKKLFPRCLHLMDEAIVSHKKEMKKLVTEEEAAAKTIPASDDWTPLAGTSKSHKILS